MIFGTGYTFSFPFLPDVQKRVQSSYRRLPGVYQHTWNIEDPTLTFVGMVRCSKMFTFVLSADVDSSWGVGSPLKHMNGKL